MMTNDGATGGDLSRRLFLRAAAGAVALPGACLGPTLDALPAPEDRRRAAWAVDPRSPYAPFRVALQSYSFRKLAFQEAIDAIYDLELRFVELWPGHLPSTIDEGLLRRRFKAMRNNLLKRIAYGVVELTKDAVRNRDIFEYARKLNVFALTANPSPDSFDSLDGLVEKFGIAVAIHNDGPDDTRYGSPELIEKAIKDRHRLIGVCVDTGHFLRAGFDPVEVVRSFEDRVYAVHLKDVKAAGAGTKTKHDTVLGEGELRLVHFLRALRDAGFEGGLALEYERESDAPQAALRKSLAALRDAVRELGATRSK